MKNLKFYLYGLTLFYQFTAFANEVHFNCFSAPNYPVQAYEFGSSNCGSINSKKSAASITKDGMQKDILCMYTAMCKPYTKTKDSPDEAKSLSEQRAIIEMQTGKYKPSILTCVGKGDIVSGVLVNPNCPLPNDCQKDVFYNFIAAENKHPMPEHIDGPIQTSDEKGQR